jgi:leucyl-tRNA synthetase
VQGGYRFLQRVWRIVCDHTDSPWANPPAEPVNFSGSSERIKLLRRRTHQTIQKVTEDLERFQFNTAIAALMSFYNDLSRDQALPQPAKDEAPLYAAAFSEAIKHLVLLLSPFAPHLTEALWETLGNPPTILDVPWPAYDPALVKGETVEVVVQVNGKVRNRFSAPAGLEDDVLRERALSDPKTERWIAGKTIKKVIVVKGKLVNIVL